MRKKLTVIVTFAAADETPRVRTTIAADPAGTSQGACTLICPGDSYKRGAGTPPTVTDVSAMDIGRGMDGAPAVMPARFEPKMEISDPGEIAAVE